METQSSPLHMLFFPFLAHGHLLPMVDLVRCFALRGVKCTFLTTPANVTSIEPTIYRTNKFIKSKNEPHLMPISVSLISFPSVEVGLPKGLENASFTSNYEMRQKFFQVCSLLEKPFEQLIKEINPDAFVSATFFPWSADVSARTGIPRLVFNGTGLLARSAQEKLQQIIESLPADTDKFVLPGLPHQLEMHRTQFFFPTTNKEMRSLFKRMNEMDAQSYGEIVNSFLELEADYVAYWREVLGRKAWLVGPVILCHEELIEKSSRGGNTSIGTEELLQWLDRKHPGSVVYICFGSITNLNTSLEQLMNIAIAIEESDCDFIWVVNSSNLEGYDNWLEGLEQRMHKEKRSLIIRGWAPQLLVLNHPAVGGFLTHCGWNSTLEAISAGVPNKFVIPGLPHQLEMHRAQFMPLTKNKEMLSMFKRTSEMDARSYGEIVNNFLELEADYVVHWREVVGRKAWLVGPAVLCNEEFIQKSSRGGNTSIGTKELLQWFDSKRPGSVVYICFGSLVNLNSSIEQLMNIAIALEKSDWDFIWVFKSSNLEGYDNWLEGFEQRMHKERRGLIIRGWAPQLLVLNHPAVGAFLTHCGWNSTLEAISAGVPMITWPAISWRPILQ